MLGWGTAAPLPPPGRPKEIASYQAHNYDINDIAISPDGKILASVGGDSHLKLWDVASGMNLFDIQAHPALRADKLGGAKNVAFSPDGKTIATAGTYDRKVKLWDVATGRKVDEFASEFAPPLVFSPDGKTLICGSNQVILETKEKRPLLEKRSGVWPVAVFDRKGKLWLATHFYWTDPPSFAVWDVNNRKKYHTCLGNSKEIFCRGFSPDGKTAVATELDYKKQRWAISLWNTATDKNTATFDRLDYLPTDAIFSPNGKVLAVSDKRDSRHKDKQGTIRLLVVPSGKVLATLQGPQKGQFRQISCMVFSPKGRLLASGSLDGVIQIWRLPDRYKIDE